MSSSTTITPETFNGYNERLQAAALKATKNAAGLPSDLAFHRSIDRRIATELDACSGRLSFIANRLLALASKTDDVQSLKGKGKAKLEDQDDYVDRFESIIVEAMDQLLEHADICLDKFSGRTKAPAIAVNGSSLPSQQKPKKSVPSGRLDPVIQHAFYLPKPQLRFRRKIENTNGTQWNSSLRHKFNAQVPLGYNFQPNGDDLEALQLPHPYRYEITHLSYPACMFQPQPPISPRSFSETPFTWVSSLTDFTTMLGKLKNAREIAIDLEHHSFRTYSGFVCLMQISTREEDWVVDTLELREEMEELNEVFTDPNIIKVFHGAESDIVWLQQDFNLYIVNMFDTFHASKVLDFPRHGLASLLEMYCDFTPDKRYQLADWRIRPLPEEMLAYARSDTHFLLYIYDNLRNALLDRALSREQSRAQSPSAANTVASRPPSVELTESLVREVLSRSAETALRVYEKEFYDEDGGTGSSGWDTMARKWNKVALSADGPNGMRKEVYKAVHAWRDKTAREEDESWRYVLSNHYLFQLADRPPADMAALLASFQSLPPLIRKRSKELLDTIRAAVKRGLGDQQTLVAPTGLQDNTLNVSPAEESSSSHLDTTPAPRLWAQNTVLPLAAATSTLFDLSRSNGPIAAFSNHYSTARSSLLGDSASSTSAIVPSRATRAGFQSILKKIHTSLVIVPALPDIIGSGARVPTSSEATPKDIGVTSSPVLGDLQGAAEEIAFTPASQRQAVQPAVDDSIVVVGQRQKKRKRTKKLDTDESPMPDRTDKETKKTQVEDGMIEVFDYATAPNILDNEPEAKIDRKMQRKKQKTKGGVLEYGNFPAPPRDRSQVKSGNTSRTFK
ncbi:hypothetical protein HETIRDRAFT_318347 [Heterobasidion irregulare TC 32-1]|uniref:HRDC domain-containing protein n=1 Tax=Heterobasidion irregulare (strain TC 32-1) TaxID=747525 RepID=W4K865_HETIT|nr:uncharacterized protein HETIRDRAFT_318347 [Heterobasidion irregulare TC 32-1]ETW81983.1 hypothetical protein HETIRDRAFT_318347 [Heterobasidion irregulare TC 32-1]